MENIGVALSFKAEDNFSHKIIVRMRLSTGDLKQRKL